MSHSAGEPPTSEVESSGVEDEKKIGLETVHGQSENEPSSDSHNHNNEGVKEVDDMESKDTNGNINSTQTTQAVLEDEGKVLPTEQADYSSFTKWEKRFIVFFATIGAFFSPFTAQIYFPALTEIAKDLHVSNSKINLTMTTYMILQATAPAFIGGFSDNAGRRPAYVICFVIYIAADVALALQNNYVALLILRMVQSAGSSGTVALANAVIADVATAAERGMYIGITSLAGILAPSLGPILGGVISQYAGWKWIFGFLAILATVFFIPFILFFPETGRNVVGDGTIPPPRLNQSLTGYINEKKRLKEGIAPDYAERDALAKNRHIRFPNPIATLVVAAEKEGALILGFAGIVYAGFYAILSGIPSQFQELYGYNELIVGLVYLPIAGGSLAAAFTQGRLIDWAYAREAKKLGLAVVKSKQQDLTNFPIERARLLVAMPMLVVSSLFTVAYGWVLYYQTNVAGPLILLFFLGYTLIASTQSISILIVDINPGLAGTATAAFNLIRCLLGAGSTALILPMTNAMGVGWAFTLIGLIYIVLSPMLLAVIRWGPGWRRARWARDAIKAKEKQERKDAKTDAAEKV